jgi:hypothetical protein
MQPRISRMSADLLRVTAGRCTPGLKPGDDSGPIHHAEAWCSHRKALQHSRVPPFPKRRERMGHPHANSRSLGRHGGLVMTKEREQQVPSASLRAGSSTACSPDSQPCESDTSGESSAQDDAEEGNAGSFGKLRTGSSAAPPTTGGSARDDKSVDGRTPTYPNIGDMWATHPG